MALVATPVPGSATRIECTGCPDKVLVSSRLAPLHVQALVSQVEGLHSCSVK